MRGLHSLPVSLACPLPDALHKVQPGAYVFWHGSYALPALPVRRLRYVWWLSALCVYVVGIVPVVLFEGIIHCFMSCFVRSSAVHFALPIGLRTLL